MAGIDDATKATMSKLPLCTIKAGPRDGEDWIKRVKEEYKALIQVRPPAARARRRPCSRAAARAHTPPPCRHHAQLPLCTIKAGPRDGEDWIKRVKEEYKALIQYQQVNKEAGNEWFTIEAANKTGTRWQGKVWTFHDSIKYEFDLEFDIPVSYPSVAPELALPELDGKTEKMYRGGKARAAATAAAAAAAARAPARTRPRSPPPPPAQICLDSHFRPLWARNEPRFGIAHAMALGMGPWLAVEIPSLVALGRIKPADEK